MRVPLYKGDKFVLSFLLYKKEYVLDISVTKVTSTHGARGPFSAHETLLTHACTFTCTARWQKFQFYDEIHTSQSPLDLLKMNMPASVDRVFGLALSCCLVEGFVDMSHDS